MRTFCDFFCVGIHFSLERWCVCMLILWCRPSAYITHSIPYMYQYQINKSMKQMMNCLRYGEVFCAIVFAMEIASFQRLLRPNKTKKNVSRLYTLLNWLHQRTFLYLRNLFKDFNENRGGKKLNKKTLHDDDKFLNRAIKSSSQLSFQGFQSEIERAQLGVENLCIKFSWYLVTRVKFPHSTFPSLPHQLELLRMWTIFDLKIPCSSYLRVLVRTSKSKIRCCRQRVNCTVC